MNKRAIISALLIVATFFVVMPTGASAASFDPGRIIDDAVFTNYQSMSVAQIQSFLNSKVPTCDTNGTLPAYDYGRSDLTHSQYAAMRGWQAPPYTCLKDYSENGVSAAQLIYNLAQQYRINPQVLLVTLQKEASLVTDTWPFNNQYRTATGYGCPDSGPNNSANCSSSYYGFTNQLKWSATMYRAVIDQSPTWYSPYIKGQNYVQWSPNASCGGTTVNVQNWSTASLYDYTPYQPNAAALNAGYGLGDSCSAYGNRNFFLFFRDWFGTPIAPRFSAQSVWQQVYTDKTKSKPIGWNASLLPGQQAYAVVVMKNTGSSVWTRDSNPGKSDVRLATFSPWGRQSAFDDGSWIIQSSRPSRLIEASVAPGGTGTFEFGIKAPSTPGTYNESFSPIVDGLTTFSTGSMNFTLSVAPATFSAQPVWQQVYSDNTKKVSLGWNASLVTRQRAHVVVAMKNTGNMTWTRSGAFTVTDTRLATQSPWGRQSAFCDPSWVIACTRPSALVEESVAPGQIGSFAFDVVAPDKAGTYTEAFAPIIDGRTVFSGGGVGVTFTVTPATFSAQPVWQQVYTDGTKSTALGWNATLAPNQSAHATVVMKNTGNMTWTRSGAFTVTDTRLATQSPWGRQSAFCDPSWVIACTRPSALVEESVAPGNFGTFEFNIKAPQKAGSYIEAFAPIIDGRTVFSGGGVGIGIKVE